MSTSTSLPPVTSASPPQTPTPTTFTTAPSLVARGEAALTTPYVYPPECENSLFLNYTSQSSSWSSYGIRGEGFLYVDREWATSPGKSNPAARWEKCQPPGRTIAIAHDSAHNDIYLDRMSVYRGAVCPSGWHAFGMGMTSASRGTKYSGDLPTTWSTANCCKSGDTYAKDEWTLMYERFPNYSEASVCISLRESTPNYYSGGGPRVTYTDQSIYSARMETYVYITKSYLTTKTYSTGEQDLSTYSETDTFANWSYYTTTATFASGRVFYPAWSIEWVASDNLSLNPPWPTLTSNMLVLTYTGQSLPTDSTYDNYGEGRPTSTPRTTSTSTENKVWIPVVAVLGGVVLLGAVVGGWLWRRKIGERKKEREEEGKEWGHEQGGEQALEMGDMGCTAALDTRPETANALPVEGEMEGERGETERRR